METRPHEVQFDEVLKKMYQQNPNGVLKFYSLIYYLYQILNAIRAILTCLKHSGRPLKFLNPN